VGPVVTAPALRVVKVVTTQWVSSSRNADGWAGRLLAQPAGPERAVNESTGTGTLICSGTRRARW
jgi:hypothetical protein